MILHSFLPYIFSLFIPHIHDKMKGEIRIMKKELSLIERYRVPKEKSLQQCESNLEATYSIYILSIEGLESELHHDLMELSVSDQRQVCYTIV